MTWLLLIAAILVEVTASLSLKGALEQPALYVVVAAGYTLSFVLLGLVLRRGMPLGLAYGVWGASGVALTAIGAALVFGEQITTLMACGIALIAGGILVVETGAQKAHTTGPAHPAGADPVAAVATATSELPVVTPEPGDERGEDPR